MGDTKLKKYKIKKNKTETDIESRIPKINYFITNTADSRLEDRPRVEPGPKGEKGDRGEQGVKGEKGDRGEKGERGDPGPRGEKGDRGEKGEPGSKGERGEQGVKGEKGDSGPKGEKGEQGVKGEKGDRGEQGVKGEKGDGNQIFSNTLYVSELGDSPIHFKTLEAAQNAAKKYDLIIVYPGSYEVSSLSKDFIYWKFLPGVKLIKLGESPLISVTEKLDFNGSADIDTNGKTLISINPGTTPNINFSANYIHNSNITNHSTIAFDLRSGGNININVAKVDTGKQQFLYLQGTGLISPSLNLTISSITIGGKIDCISLNYSSTSNITIGELNCYLGNGIYVNGGNHIITCKEIGSNVILKDGVTIFHFTIFRNNLEIMGGNHYIKGLVHNTQNPITLSGEVEGSLEIATLRAANIAIKNYLQGGNFKISVGKLYSTIGLLTQKTQYASTPELKFIVERAKVDTLCILSEGSKIDFESNVQRASGEKLYVIEDIDSDSEVLIYTRGSSKEECFQISRTSASIKISGSYKSDKAAIETQAPLIIYNCFLFGTCSINTSYQEVEIRHHNTVLSGIDAKIKLIPL